jgi:predicted transcriptional regulator
MESVVSKPVDPVGLASDIVSAFVSHNSLPATELPALIQSVHEALTRLSSGAISSTTTTVGPEATTPAVSIRKSITPEFLICLDDGRKFKSLKRHLAGLGMTPDQYRSKWQLPHDYPMVAPNYASFRSALAKKSGLGQLRAGVNAAKTESASKGKLGRVRRPRKATA